MDAADPALFEELMDAIRQTASKSAFVLGQEVEDFEGEFAAFCEAEHAVGVSSGTDALQLSLRAMGIGPGDEVIVPANSFVASAAAVTLTGATPRFADVDPETCNLSAQTIEPALGPAVRAIIAVHLYGRPADMEPILALAARHDLAVIEDAAQAHGARYRGKRVGGLGTCACFSFYPAKNLGAWGDGGTITTNDAELADRVRLLRSHGERPRHHHGVVGTTGRLDAIQAAILRIKLRRLDEWNQRRRQAAEGLSGALEMSAVGTPAPLAQAEDHVFHQYVVTSEDRDGLREHLSDAGVATGIHYPVPIHRSEAYSHLGLGPGSLPVAEALAERICSLPMSPALDEPAVERIAAAVCDFKPAHDRAAA